MITSIPLVQSALNYIWGVSEWRRLNITAVENVRSFGVTGPAVGSCSCQVSITECYSPPLLPSSEIWSSFIQTNDPGGLSAPEGRTLKAALCTCVQGTALRYDYSGKARIKGKFVFMEINLLSQVEICVALDRWKLWQRKGKDVRLMGQKCNLSFRIARASYYTDCRVASWNPSSHLLYAY
jgi:hypothetical protein